MDDTERGTMDQVRYTSTDDQVPILLLVLLTILTTSLTGCTPTLSHFCLELRASRVKALEVRGSVRALGSSLGAPCHSRSTLYSLHSTLH